MRLLVFQTLQTASTVELLWRQPVIEIKVSVGGNTFTMDEDGDWRHENGSYSLGMYTSYAILLNHIALLDATVEGLEEYIVELQSGEV